MDKLKIKPRRFPLDGKGTWWELRLCDSGWNNLPESDRYGYVIESNGEFGVFFPTLNITETDIFPDEVVFIDGG